MKAEVAKPTSPTLSPARVRARQAFLAELARTCQVAHSARVAKIDRSTAYAWRDADPEFRMAWEKAIEVAAGILEDAAIERAVNGTLRPVYQGGIQVGEIREYSDSLLVQLLKAHLPEKYRERSEITSNVNVALQIDATSRAVRIAALMRQAAGIAIAAGDSRAAGAVDVEFRELPPLGDGAAQ